MTGIILIVILVVWFFVVFKVSGKCVAKMAWSGKKYAYRMILFVLFFLAPVADDIAGGFQFRALCRSSDILIYDEKKIAGKTVQLKRPEYRTVRKIIPITEQLWDWVDPNTGESLIRYKDYNAKGGWLSRFIGFPQGSPPYTFDGSRRCGSMKANQLFEKLKITEITQNYYGE